MKSNVVCVQHRDGWCAVGEDVVEPQCWNTIRTLCNHFITMPFGIKKRRPTCPECLAMLDKQDSPECGENGE